MIVVDESLCKGCHICVQFCPFKVLGISDTVTLRGIYPPYAAHPEKCTSCKLCELMCPDFAIGVEKEGEGK